MSKRVLVGASSRGFSRRTLLAAMAGGLALGRSGWARATEPIESVRWDTIVVGAGVFGAWSAWHLHEAGERVLLLDAGGPANSRASSGGESRMTRALYGPDELYARMASESLPQWRWLSGRAGLPVFIPCGVLMFFPRAEAYAQASIESHRRLGLPLEVLDRDALRRRYPQARWDDIEFGLLEPGFGALLARRSVQTLVAAFEADGGTYRTAAARPPAAAADAGRLGVLHLEDGSRLAAQRFVFACGPWLPKLFPDLLGTRIFPTRQEVFFFAPPAGDPSYRPVACPGWADFNGGDIYYGFPDLESRGFKIAHDAHGPAFDPDSGDRQATTAGLERVRAYLARRFPRLADQPMIESRVCQYENTANGDLLIDRHPRFEDTWLVGGGSGHGFKHGPAVGRYVAELLRGRLAAIEPRFALAGKPEHRQRAVH